MTKVRTTRVNVGLLARVSDPGQHNDNQLPDLLAWAERRGFEVVVTYQFQESAWKGAHQKQLTQVYQDARTGKFQVLLVWALDRLSREGHWEPWKSYIGWVRPVFRYGLSKSPGLRQAGNCWTCC